MPQWYRENQIILLLQICSQKLQLIPQGSTNYIFRAKDFKRVIIDKLDEKSSTKLESKIGFFCCLPGKKMKICQISTKSADYPQLYEFGWR